MKHLMHRAGFGFGTFSLDDLHHPAPADPPGFDPYVPNAMVRTWLSRMLSGEQPLAEKLALFWHGHFATSLDKVQDEAAMWGQYRLFRGSGARRFVDLVLDVSRDPAMLRWLDGVANVKGHPNENYGRELMELFTLGVGHYGEHDVREAARALSGWTTRLGRSAFEPAWHDDGDKRVLGRPVHDTTDLVQTLCATPACAQHMARQLLRFFVQDPPPEDAVRRLAAVWQAHDGKIDTVLGALFEDPAFRYSEGQHIKSPVEFLVGALYDQGAVLPDWAPQALTRMGQTLFAPPSVKGWPGGMAWLGALSMVERFQCAALLGAARDATPEYQVS